MTMFSETDLPPTHQRVERHTSEAINRREQERIKDRVDWHSTHPETIEARLREIEREWDIERALEANASTLAFFGTFLGAMVSRRFLAIPAIVTAFLFQHAVQGWCPPVPVLRRLGFRTAHEMYQEYYALKAARGDFSEAAKNADKAYAAVSTS